MAQAHYTKTKLALLVIAAVAVIVACYSAVPAQAPPVQIRSVWDGVYTDAQAGRGAKIYVSDCASCHGKHLNGIDDSPSLAGKEFMDSWDGRTLAALLAQMRKMPRDAPGRLSPTEYADTMAYILSVNKFPSGKTDLPQESEPLRNIRLDLAKPAANK